MLGTESQERASSWDLLGVFIECKFQLEASGHKKAFFSIQVYRCLLKVIQGPPKAKNPIVWGSSVSKTFTQNQEIVCETRTAVLVDRGMQGIRDR